ncbi:hypothetical protein ACFZCP_06330 [Streptomyces sp. NPDC007971]
MKAKVALGAVVGVVVIGAVSTNAGSGGKGGTPALWLPLEPYVIFM